MKGQIASSGAVLDMRAFPKGELDYWYGYLKPE
jgi:hypothetical protein